MAGWEQLRRAIRARDVDATERIWFELLESDPRDPKPFIEAADIVSRQPGGRRAASGLLGLLVDVLKEKERHHALIPVYGRLASYAPDDGTLREAVTEAAQQAFPEREDLDVLLEKSGVRGGPNAQLEEQIDALERYLQIEKDAYVFHKSGWGVGRIVEYHPERGRCVIDFRTRPGHEMDVEAAARLLERLDEDDIRVQAMADPRGLRQRAKEQPLEMLRQTLARYGNSAQLRNLREALVPDAVATSTWSAWWKEAKKHALLDPRFEVGSGRDPRVEFHDIAQTDFRTQVERALKGSATTADRQKALRELSAIVASNDEAKTVLVEAVERELGLTRGGATRVGWVRLLADLTGRDPLEGLGEALASASDPVEVVHRIEDDETRGLAARALVRHLDGGAEMLVALALADDPEAAEVAAEVLPATDRAELFEELLRRIDARPAQRPNLYAWYVRGLVRGRWAGRRYEPMALVLRLLKVLDAVEYRARRTSALADKQAVSKLNDILTRKSCALVHEASDDAEEDAAHHLVLMLGQNRGLKSRARQKLQDVVLRVHPLALKDHVDEVAAGDEGAVQQHVYMTARGLARLRAEHDQIVNVDLPANSAEIARAREFGDLSENAEYHAAREKHSLLEAKAKTLKADLARAVEIKPEIVRVDAVSVGSRVRLRDPRGSEITYTLFGPPDADVSRGVISYLTPLGQALMGRTPGDHVRLDIDGEVRELEVLGIENGLSEASAP